MQAAIALIIAYLIGSISSAIIICKIANQPDPRTQGSGNAGATNMLRFAGKKLALLTLLFDILKGTVAVFIGKIIGVEGVFLGLVAFAAFLGHLYPIYFKFRGGKGVATLIGGCLGLSLPLGFAVIITWLIIAIVFRYSSLAAMIAAVLAPFYGIFLTRPVYAVGIALMSTLLLWRHRANIERLRLGTESKIGKPFAKK